MARDAAEDPLLSLVGTGTTPEEIQRTQDIVREQYNQVLIDTPRETGTGTPPAEAPTAYSPGDEFFGVPTTYDFENENAAPIQDPDDLVDFYPPGYGILNEGNNQAPQPPPSFGRRTDDDDVIIEDD